MVVMILMTHEKYRPEVSQFGPVGPKESCCLGSSNNPF